MSPHIEAVGTKAEFVERVFESEKPVVVDFWAEWCGPCKALAPHFEALAEQHHERVRFVKVDTEAAPEVARAAGIRSLPTLGFYWKGELRDVSVGMKSPAHLEKLVNKLVAKAEGKGLLARLFG